jgi:hypothetical protein
MESVARFAKVVPRHIAEPWAEDEKIARIAELLWTNQASARDPPPSRRLGKLPGRSPPLPRQQGRVSSRPGGEPSSRRQSGSSYYGAPLLAERFRKCSALACSSRERRISSRRRPSPGAHRFNPTLTAAWWEETRSKKLYQYASDACATIGAMNMAATQLPRIAIASGDPAGIGPEISLKAALDAQVRRMCRPLVVGDPMVLETHARAARVATPFHVVTVPRAADWTGDAVNPFGRTDARAGGIEIRYQ